MEGADRPERLPHGAAAVLAAAIGLEAEAVGVLGRAQNSLEGVRHHLRRQRIAQTCEAVRMGVTNEQFHADLFRRILDSHARGKFPFLDKNDLVAITKMIEDFR